MLNITRMEQLVQPFSSYPLLQTRVRSVLHRLPQEVQLDFVDDPLFQITLEDYSPENGWQLFMAWPTMPSEVSRCVVLRHRLEHAAEEFAHYVIAHEFAHAYLRNGGWGEIADKEEAADALAATWGFARPPFAVFFRR